MSLIFIPDSPRLSSHYQADIVASDPGIRGAGRYIFDHKGLDFI